MSTTPTPTGATEFTLNTYDIVKTCSSRQQVKRGGVMPITSPTPSMKTTSKPSDKVKPPIASTSTRKKSKKSSSTALPPMISSPTMPSKAHASKPEPSLSHVRNPVSPTTPRSPRKTRASRKSVTSHITPTEVDVSSTSAFDSASESESESDSGKSSNTSTPSLTGWRVEDARRMQIPEKAKRVGRPILGLTLAQREPREPVPKQELDLNVFDSSDIHSSEGIFERSPESSVERMDPRDIAKKMRQVDQDLEDYGDLDYPTKADGSTIVGGNGSKDTDSSPSHDEDGADDKPESRIRKRVSSDSLTNSYVAEDDGPAPQTLQLPNIKRRRCKSSEDSAQPNAVEEDIHELADAER